MICPSESIGRHSRRRSENRRDCRTCARDILLSLWAVALESGSPVDCYSRVIWCNSPLISGISLSVTMSESHLIICAILGSVSYENAMSVGAAGIRVTVCGPCAKALDHCRAAPVAAAGRLPSLNCCFLRRALSARFRAPGRNEPLELHCCAAGIGALSRGGAERPRRAGTGRRRKAAAIARGCAAGSAATAGSRFGSELAAERYTRTPSCTAATRRTRSSACASGNQKRLEAVCAISSRARSAMARRDDPRLYFSQRECNYRALRRSAANDAELPRKIASWP